jgi:hypothetical protein
LTRAFLVAEGFGFHIDKAFIYGPMAFAIFVEALNLVYSARKAKRAQKEQHAVQLRPQYPDVDESVAVHAALSTDPRHGSVGLSNRPVAGDDDPAPGGERQGLG